MLDIRLIRENPEFVDKKLTERGSTAVSAEVIELDQQHRSILTNLQDLQSQRNQIAKEFGIAKREGRDTAILSTQAETIKQEIQSLEDKARASEEKLKARLWEIPNLASEDVPIGLDECHNVEVTRFGEPKKFSFTPKSHFELGENLGLMSFENAAKISGARFVVLYGDLARLERALALFMLDIHTKEFGYTEVSPPLLVQDHAMYGTGQLPKFREDQFLTTHGLWLIPTAEVSLTNLAREEILASDKLPLRYVAHTPCFRAEAGAAGRDTRGMIRQHQFSKVELVSITTPEQSVAEHERMTHAAETILQRLCLSYRKVLLCTGDMGFCAQKTYDLEVWLPGEGKYREISSCSNCGDFQARRMNARFKTAQGEKPAFVHTLNGSGLAVGRTLIAVLENYQQEDGSIIIPDALKPYMSINTIAKT